jgi:hypothetical protein
MSDTNVQLALFMFGMPVVLGILMSPLYFYIETDWGLRRRELAYLRAQGKRAECAYQVAQLDMQEARDGWQQQPAKRVYLVALLDFQEIRYGVYDWLWRVRD